MVIKTAILEQDVVARASLIQYNQKHIQILVVAAQAGKWQEPQPKNEPFEAYVKGSGVEAYLIVINSQKPVQPQESSTWEGLQGIIMEAFYSPNATTFIPEHAVTDHPIPRRSPDTKGRLVEILASILKAAGVRISPDTEGGLVEIPASILKAAGICRQGAFNVSPLSLEHSLSPEDLAYVRNNCIRETR